jgi:diadenosine tetraphosphate (Ap4A) HIT family hydrolase
MTFVLHPRLAADSIFVEDWPLSRLLLLNDARYAWLVLVPRRRDMVELHDLTAADQTLLMEEIARAGAGLKTLTGATKINTGALGNIVPQLHIHVVARKSGDPAWPGPVWGHSAPEPYTSAGAEERLTRLRGHL